MSTSSSKMNFINSLLKDARKNVSTLIRRPTSESEVHVPDRLTKQEKQMKDTSKNEVLFSIYDIQGPIREPEQNAQTNEMKEVQLLEVEEHKVKKKVSFDGNGLDETFTVSLDQIRDQSTPNDLLFPFKALRLLNLQHWITFMVAWLALYADYVDYLSLAIATRKIALHFKTTKTHVSTAITLTFLLRPVGAILFGILSDYYGRRWPLAIILIFLGIFQIASIRADSFAGFLCSRAFFGIGMGGLVGITSLIFDICPPQARGSFGGLLHTAIPCASITSAGMNMAFGADPSSYKLMFWVGTAISFFAAMIRAVVPDSPQFRQSRLAQLETDPNARRLKVKVHRFLRNFKQMLVQDWKTLIYCAIFVSLNAWVHNSFGNNHFTFLQSAKGMDNKTASKIAMLCNLGSLTGVLLGGALSQYYYSGRRRMAIICSIFAIFLIPAAVLPTSPAGLTIGCIFFYIFVQGYAGIVPSRLNELSPKAFRAFFTGTAHQLGTMIAAPAAQSVNAIAESHHKTLANDAKVEAYEPVIAIAAFIALFLSVFWVAIGPEKRNTELRDFVPAAIAKNQDDEEVA